MTVALTGNAVIGQGQLTLTPTQTDFGPLAIGSSSTMSFNVTNTGNIPITITSVNPPTGGVFTAVTPPSCGGACTTLLGFVLNPGDVVSQPVSASPTASGPVTGQFTLTANDGRGPQTETLTATGIPGPGIDTKTTAFSATGTASASVSTNQPGDLVVAFVAGDKPGPGSGQTATVSGGGLTWTLAQRTNTQPGTAEIWTAPAPAVLANAAITATLALAANVELNVVAFTNASGIGAVASGNAFGGAPAAALTTTHANSWVYGVGFDWSQGLARTLGSGQTMVDQVLQPGGTFWTQSETVPTGASGTTVTINDTAPSTDYWNLGVVEILGSASAPSAPVITSAAAATFAVGSAGSFTVVASGSPAPAFSETGALPSGVTLSSAGVLSGTPAAGSAASYPITITAANGVLPNATQSFTLTVNTAGSAPVISECRGGDVCGGLGGVVYGGGVGFSGAGVLRRRVLCRRG